jgi:hypothetical protein
VASADPSGPDALPIHVVSVKTDDVDDQAEALTAALKAEVRKLHGWSLGDGDFSLEVLTLALRCPTPPDAACEVRIADQIKANRFVWGTVKRAPGKRVAGTLHLWTRDQGQTKVDIAFSDNLTDSHDDALRRVVQDALATLTGGPPKGSVRVSAGTVNGQVFIDGQPSGSIRDGSTTIFVPVGTHKVEVRAPGYAPAVGEVTVRPNSSVGLSLSPQTEEEARKAGRPLSARRIGGYGALVAGGALAVGGVYSSLRVNSISKDEGFAVYRSVVDGDVCDAARAGASANPKYQAVLLAQKAPTDAEITDKCSSASTFQTLQWVFYGLGAVSLGVGAYLLATDKPSADRPSTAARVRVLPSVWSSSGRLDVHVSF